MRLHEIFLKTNEIQLEKSLDSLTEKIDQAILKFGSVFVKSSSRSPKDVRNDELLKKKFESEMKDKQQDSNTKLWILLQVATEMLKLKTSKEVLELFIKSKRVHEDFGECFQLVGEDKFNVSLIIRKWYEPLSIDKEYRCFIYNGQMNAISQYNYLCYFQQVNENKSKIQKQILDFFNGLKVSQNNYILDLHVTDEEIKVIELNPFENATGTCLFNWKKDGELLKNGPFEFRITTSPIDDLIPLIEPGFHQFFK